MTHPTPMPTTARSATPSLAALTAALVLLAGCGPASSGPSSTPGTPGHSPGGAADSTGPSSGPADHPTGDSTASPAAYRAEELTLTEQPALAIRGQAAPAELQDRLGGQIARLLAHAMTNQLEIAGPPFVRYFSRSDQLIEYQAGLPVFKLPAGSGPDAETSITATSLPAGPAIATVHVGRYEDLPDAHAFLRSWAERAERAPGGAMWEVFLTNPMTQRDPSKWRTKVFLPLAPLPSGH